MILTYCDSCNNRLDNYEESEEVESHFEALKQKGPGALVVDVARVVKRKDGECYFRPYDLCSDCMKKAEKVVLEALFGGSGS